MTDEALKISVLGEVAVIRGDAAAVLPSSRKARALLGFLATTGRPVRRERLCELFWDLPDDPRGSLRWALSKLRPVVDSGDAHRIVADRERVALDRANVDVDIVAIRKRLLDDPPFIPPAELRVMAEQLSHVFLDGLDSAGEETFQAWLSAERDDIHLLHLNVLRRLALHPDMPQPEAVNWAKRWQYETPLQAESARGLITALTRAGRMDEAKRAEDDFRTAAAAAGIEVTEPLQDDLSARTIEEDTYVRPPEPRPRQMLRNQNIGFCHASDGARIAYATVGEGRPLVKAANWLNHLVLDWGSPIWGQTFAACADGRQFIRYDERGNGLSDWEVEDLSFEAFVKDLETVVDALGLERFPLLGISQGCAVSVEYAARHPERVSGLVLISGYATGWRIGASAEEQERREAVLTLTRHGWGTSNPAYRHIFSQTFMPDAKPEELAWFDEFQRQTTSAENAVRFQEAFGDIDVRETMGKVQAPTIVFHARNDQRIAIEQGRDLAVGIPGAEFVPLDSRNHILLGHEPAWQECVERTTEFLTQHDI
ncbi:alpha/beta fold hydrolase [Aliiroseovarius sp. YM-037]|uniref:alpha/beta fold hydrolase n=1 Tax=Aliiroseovarius sp. YM-037 TaxID=3341728 RepID=UPI003A7FAECC